MSIKKLAKWAVAQAGFEVHRRCPGGVPVDPVIHVCDRARVPRLPAMDRVTFEQRCPPLFPIPREVPRDIPLRHHAGVEELLHNASMKQYFRTTTNPSGNLALTDAFPDSHWCSRQRMLSTVYQKFIGPTLEGCSVLDVGCSSGYYGFFADRLGAREVVGLDARPEHEEQFLLLHRLLGARPGCRYQHMDMEHGLEPLDGSFDVVLAQGVLYHVFDHPRFLRNMFRLTRRVLVLEGACSGRRDEYCRAMLENPRDLRESIHGPVLYPSLSWMIDVVRWAGFRNVCYICYPEDLPTSVHHATLWRAMLVGEK